MRRPTERRWVPWLNGVRRTTSHSTSTRPRSWWWITGDRAENTHPSPSTRHLWSGWPALSSSAFTSLRISHGLLTQMLRWLRKFGTSSRILRSFYTCTVESILTGCITAWYGNSTAGNRRALQRVVRTARHIVGGELPSLQDIYTRRCTRKARRIIKDSSHPSHRLLSLLPSGRRFRSIRSRTSRLRDSFFPSGYQANEQSEITHLHHTPTHTTSHALHFNTVLPDYTHTLH